MLSVLGRRYPQAHIVIRPARVQGDGAAPDLTRALGAVGRVPGVDVVLLVRGGGSIEDLWAFNEEMVARAIVRCEVPVISGVGHETDVTIADFAADLRCPTPSAAAETVVARRDEFVARIDRHLERVRAALDRRLLGARSRVHALESRRGLAAVRASVAMRGRHVMELGQALQRAMTERAARDGRRIAILGRSLARHDPRARLARSRGQLGTLDARLLAGVRRRQQRTTRAILGECRTSAFVEPAGRPGSRLRRMLGWRACQNHPSRRGRLRGRRRTSDTRRGGDRLRGHSSRAGRAIMTIKDSAPIETIKDFEAALTELESIVKRLEDGDLTLESSLALYERGVELSRFCHSRLEQAERRIEILNERGDLKTRAAGTGRDEIVRSAKCEVLSGVQSEQW